MPRRPNNLEQEARRRRNLAYTYRAWMRGVPAQEIAIALNVNLATVYRYQAWLKTNWIAPDGLRKKDLQDELQERIASLNHIKQNAWEVYERSKGDNQEVIKTEKLCRACGGTGLTDKLNGECREWCPTCEGEGSVYGEASIKVRGQAGDVSALRVVLDCDREIARLQGLQEKAQVVFQQNIQVNNETKNLTMNVDNADPDAIIRARVAFEELERSARIGNGNGQLVLEEE